MRSCRLRLWSLLHLLSMRAHCVQWKGNIPNSSVAAVPVPVSIVAIVLALFGDLGSEPIALESYESCYMPHFKWFCKNKYSLEIVCIFGVFLNSFVLYAIAPLALSTNCLNQTGHKAVHCAFMQVKPLTQLLLYFPSLATAFKSGLLKGK